MGLDRFRKRFARDQPRLVLVDDGRDEDRPRRPQAARSGDGAERVRRVSRRRTGGLRFRYDCGSLRAAAVALRARHRGRRRRVVALAFRHARYEAGRERADQPRFAALFALVSWRDRTLGAISQAGLVNNLNDGLAWGILPLYFAATLDVDHVAILAAAYPATWGLLQLATGPLSDRLGRKALIASGMWLQALAIGLFLVEGR